VLPFPPSSYLAIKQPLGSSLTMRSYCASPLSGMGTTLAMFGAYNLAGALGRFSNDPAAAFAEYEQKMRPSVDKAQQLAPGLLRIMNPRTAWDVWTVDIVIICVFAIARFVVWTRLPKLLSIFTSSEKPISLVEEYGLRELPEWEE
jgi:hypothetical protein